ncbi:hypothetical protein D3227_17100 [Mesorhizobium waimense]|uniref:Uncharacterized protein n=2 Tax=Mesorhizobium waimense TaxID=1300307 RepID=A0A3A5KR81_9HYPH|nr:hypothetical protein D3227_17100 [Mesorhizobium waimense]
MHAVLLIDLDAMLRRLSKFNAMPPTILPHPLEREWHTICILTDRQAGSIRPCIDTVCGGQATERL